MPILKTKYTDQITAANKSESPVQRLIAQYLSDPTNLSPGMAAWKGAKPVAGDVVSLFDDAIKEAKIVKLLGNNEYLAKLLTQAGKTIEDRVPITRMKELLRIRGVD